MNAPEFQPAADSLAALMQVVGPVADVKSAARLQGALQSTADAAGWRPLLDKAWPALASCLSAAPYLAALARQRPEVLQRLLASEPLEALAEIIEAVRSAPRAADPADALRRCKAQAHLLTALADLGRVWSLEQVTGALSDIADAAVEAAMEVVAADERRKGRLLTSAEAAAGPLPGFFLLALGKLGARELNYSSDIDVTAFYDPEALPVVAGVEPNAFASRYVQAVAALLQDRTAEGYVFRVDLRLRPDPSSTPPAAPIEAALEYYESAGQNWERAAFIKARWCAGDRPRGEAFLRTLQPFVWRRSLDFAAIDDVKSIKRQIHAQKGGEATAPAGADLKLGRGGIREIEFYVQTQQLILGGRDPSLRSPRTREALTALAAAGHVSPAAARDLDAAYVRLRDLEHRVQMLNDEHTHRLPLVDDDRRRVAALAGEPSLAKFDRSVSALLRRVNKRYGELFSDAEPLSSSRGSLVFTGVDDDPETLDTLSRLGFAEPATASALVRRWHHGHVPATRSERGRELFTRLAPRLLEAASETGVADLALRRFARFFGGLSGGVQVQSLLLARPELLALLVEVLAYAPRLATTLARHPATLDALLDEQFMQPLRHSEEAGELQRFAAAADGFETAMDAVRRTHREQSFRIGVHVLSGRAKPEDAGAAFADLADACIQALAPAASSEVNRLAGSLPGGRVAVVALGKAGSREMTASSDLDLMVVYDAPADTESEHRGWQGETYYGRFCQRLTAALSVPTSEGGLYDVDLRLRPTGGKGPVAAPLSGLRRYYAEEAEAWELMALTRARVVWSDPVSFAGEVQGGLAEALKTTAEPQQLSRDVAEMRALVASEKPPQGFWDLKLSSGGLMDAEFAAQRLELALIAGGAGTTQVGTLRALEAARAAGLISDLPAQALADAWRMQQSLAQLLAVAVNDGSDPAAEPARFKHLLSRAGGAASFPALVRRLGVVRRKAHAAFLAVVSADGSGLALR